MQTHTKLRDRLLSFILVLVMIVGLIPMGIVDAQAAGTYQNVTDAIKGNGGSITLNVNLLNSYGTADNIVSSHGNVAQYLGQYSGYGLSGFGYCANHSGRATNGMSVTVTEAHKVKSPVVINTYFSGYTDENRDEDYFTNC